MNPLLIKALGWFSVDAARERATRRADAVMQLAYLNDNRNAPADLQDKTPPLILARDGTAIASHALPSDTGRGGMAPGAVFWMLAVLMLGAGHWGAAMGLLAMLALVHFILSRDLAIQRQIGTLTGESQVYEQARAVQLAKTGQKERAAKDSSPVFRLGVSRGLFAAAGDTFAIDRDSVAALSVVDLNRHLAAFGSTGSGKTSGVLRGLWKQYTATEFGILVGDGKGDLPREFENTPNYSLINPLKSVLPLLGALEPHEVSNALFADDGTKGDKSGDFWDMSARSYVYHSANVLFAANKVNAKAMPWSFLALFDMMNANDTAMRDDALALVLEAAGDQPLPTHIMLSASWFKRFASLPSNMSGSIVGTAEAMLSPICEHPHFSAWLLAEPGQGIDVTDVLRGARMGLDVPFSRYGRAAEVVSRLVRGQIYRAAQNRGSRGFWDKTQRDALIMIDEAAIALGGLEQAMLPIARSLGLSFVTAAQNFEQYADRFGLDGAKALIDQFRSIITLETSAATLEYLREREGKILRVVEDPQPVITPSRYATRDAVMGSRFGLERNLLGSLVDLTADATSRAKGQFGRIEISDAVPESVILAAGEALCLLSRAGAPRRDVVLLDRHFGA